MFIRIAEVGKQYDASGENIDDGVLGIARIRSTANILEFEY